MVKGQEKLKPAQVDQLEFAPGYPKYTVSALEQLRHFPLPRFSADALPPRNFPWFDIKYLHRELPPGVQKGFGKMAVEKAVEMTDELVSNWNYYIDIPCIRRDSVTANKIYADPSTVEGAIVQYANEHPTIPGATILFHLQNNGKDLGFEGKNFIKSQTLPDEYYLLDENNKPVISSGKKWLSPQMPLDIVQKDALVSRMYLRQLLKHLERPIEFINENGEVFGHMRPKNLLAKDSKIKKHMDAMQVSNSVYNGWFQNRLDSCYRATILVEPGLEQTKFSFYNVSAVQAGYWPDYSSRKNTNSTINGEYHSTPSFYPRYPAIWLSGKGSSNGYGQLAWGRYQEIVMGQRFFSPFVSAGWGLEEQNIRPAQWLGLLKAMCMLGADFFYTGYFNVTGKTGWTDGSGPNDPAGYVYQIAIPAYAQAIAVMYKDFVEKGELINPSDTAKHKMWSFRFNTKNKNELTMVRKMEHKYLIYGTLQPNSNIKGSNPVKAITSIVLENKVISFEIRRQGSTYILDLSLPDQPVWLALDGWHQYEHPWYWSKDVVMEAENTERLSGVTLITERPEGSEKFDFTDFITYVQLQPGNEMNITLPQKRNQPLSATFILKKQRGNPVLLIRTKAGIIKKAIDLKPIYLSAKELNTLQLHSGENLNLSVEKGVILLDKIIF